MPFESPRCASILVYYYLAPSKLAHSRTMREAREPPAAALGSRVPIHKIALLSRRRCRGGEFRIALDYELFSRNARRGWCRLRLWSISAKSRGTAAITNRSQLRCCSRKLTRPQQIPRRLRRGKLRKRVRNQTTVQRSSLPRPPTNCHREPQLRRARSSHSRKCTGSTTHMLGRQI